MPILYPSDGSDSILADMLDQEWGDVLLDLPRNAANTLEDAQRSFEKGRTFAVFYPTLHDLAEGVLVTEQTAKAWRCLLVQNGHVLAQLEAERNGRPKAIHIGQAKDAIRQAIATAETVEGRYRIDAVEVPAIKLCALRLSEVDNGGTAKAPAFLIAYEPDATGLPFYTTKRIEEAMTLLRLRAQEVLRLSEEDPLSGG